MVLEKIDDIQQKANAIFNQYKMEVDSGQFTEMLRALSVFVRSERSEVTQKDEMILKKFANGFRRILGDHSKSLENNLSKVANELKNVFDEITKEEISSIRANKVKEATSKALSENKIAITREQTNSPTKESHKKEEFSKDSHKSEFNKKPNNKDAHSQSKVIEQFIIELDILACSLGKEIGPQNTIELQEKAQKMKKLFLNPAEQQTEKQKNALFLNSLQDLKQWCEKKEEKVNYPIWKKIFKIIPETFKGHFKQSMHELLHSKEVSTGLQQVKNRVNKYINPSSSTKDNKLPHTHASSRSI